MNSKLKGIIWIALVCGIAFYFSSSVAFLVKFIPRSTEKKLAQKLSANFHPDLCANANEKAQQALAKFTARLYPLKGIDDKGDFELVVRFVHNDQVNAFATLGGDIYVYSGLLRDVSSPEELAGVIAHEMVHQKERHVLKGILASLIIGGNAVPDNFFKIAFSQGDEREADVLGLERLKAAKINAQGYIDFFSKRGDEPGWIKIVSDHPGSAERKMLAQKYLNLPHVEILSKDEWQLVKNWCR